MNKQLFLPTLLIPEVYYPYSNEKGATANIIEKVAEDGFYRAVEIGSGYETSERKSILKTAESHNLIVTAWLTNLIIEKNLDVSALDSEVRREAVKYLKEALQAAAECGASNIAFISGLDPGINFRKDAFQSFYQTLCEVCEEAERFNMKVLVEPLDREAHKKRFLGPTSEAVALFEKVRVSYSNIGFAFDTAHAALNGESIYEALALAKPYINQLHFSNAVLNIDHNLYGDRHIRIGKPGFLDNREIGNILQAVKDIGIASDQGLRVSIEVRGSEKQALHENEKLLRVVLEKALLIHS
ncbi:sugar phosphate isomerase/epimerase family protein [Cytobacillus massiliigabonensis]|uniref:sugar phosphate isomerase/epimerase family protein n=1 Tax=Cytobacillus massiliigabonensis TaxID=1871011 RepID=UPI000C833AF8|nr:sugar phosphate isomerase/epimerase family protein [Cytobacillus massiliigabonensis]